MKIFDKRPLASILCIMLLGFVAFSQGEVWLRICAIAIAPLLLLFSALRPNIRKLLIGLCAALIISLLCSYLYFDLWFFPDNRFIGDREIEGTVYELTSDDSSATIILKTESISDEPMSAYKLIMYVDSDQAEEIEVGNKIRFRGRIECFKSDSEFDRRTYYASLGINAKCILSDSIEVIAEGAPPLSHSISVMRERISRRAMSLSDTYSGKLVSALILGERSMLDGKLTLDFTRIGVTHMLALSGMHLAILSIGLTKLLAFFGIGKKSAAVCNIIFTVLYMILTGLPISVVRAGIMLIILSVLFLLVGSYDSITSLSIAVFIICLIDPTTIFDLSLWLSAFATFGIIILSEYEKQKIDRRKRPQQYEGSMPLKILIGFLNWLKQSLLASLFAIAATLLISLMSFSGISLLSAISTAVLAPFIQLVMYIGVLMLIIGDIIPIGMLLSPISRLVGLIAASLSSLDNIYVSSNYTVTVVLGAIVSVLLILFFVFKINKRGVAVAVIALSLLTTYTVTFCLNLASKNEDDIIYINGDRRSTFVIKSDGVCGVICSASYNEDAYSEVCAAMDEERLTELDFYFATHYGFGLINHFELLASTYKIDTLVIPSPRCNDERSILAWLEKHAEEYRVKIEFFESKTAFMCGDVGITLNHSTVYGEDTIRTAFTLTDADTVYTYLSSGMLLEDYSNFSHKITMDSDVLILGSHGKSYTEIVNITESFLGVDTFILCSNNLFFTQDSLDFYTEKGCKIYSHPSTISIKIKD